MLGSCTCSTPNWHCAASISNHRFQLLSTFPPARSHLLVPIAVLTLTTLFSCPILLPLGNSSSGPDAGACAGRILQSFRTRFIFPAAVVGLRLPACTVFSINSHTPLAGRCTEEWERSTYGKNISRNSAAATGASAHGLLACARKRNKAGRGYFQLL